MYARATVASGVDGFIFSSRAISFSVFGISKLGHFRLRRFELFAKLGDLVDVLAISCFNALICSRT